MQRLNSLIRDSERQREEERRRREEVERERCEEGDGGGWEEMRAVVRDTLHQPPLSEDEYIALRGQNRGEVTDEEKGEKQALVDYIRVSCIFLFTIEHH